MKSHALRQSIAAALAVFIPVTLVIGDEPFDYALEGQFWSFQAPSRHNAPDLNDPDWVRRPHDAFVLAKLEAAGMTPNGTVAKSLLVRRLSFDLVGLPPELELDAELSIDSYVDQLLESPHFGERWARLWLDVARYAEDQAHIVGSNNSLTYPNAYLYRDWVISALNEDLPYDDFLRHQLAADLIFPDQEGEHAALGFMGLGPKYYRRNQLAVMADEWEDRVDTLTRGVLGLTVACARCHDHFFDPIPTSDYYALAGVFANTEMFNRPMEENCEMQNDGQTKKPDDAAHVVREASEMKNLPVYLRGDITNPGEEVPRGFLTILGNGQREEFDPQTSGRQDLAEALVDRHNPLTARVWVNRVWAELMGSPLVSTLSNFGTLGEKPTHPELLDDLAVRFMEDGNWSLKWLIREIVHSATYQQSSEAVPVKLAADPGNTLLWRMNRRRLDVEKWRDALLVSSGTLDRSIGGKSFVASDPDANRRAIYVEVSRLQLDPMLALFDFPDPNLHSPGRSSTTTPLQKLFVINHPLMVKQAELISDRVAAECGDLDEKIDRIYELLFSRLPLPSEREPAFQFLQEANFPDYTQVLLASNEFTWLD
ncbi:MAG: DUF1549 and DUF1553 domain-containing protein [Verrucomicrobiota bacterium]